MKTGQHWFAGNGGSSFWKKNLIFLPFLLLLFFLMVVFPEQIIHYPDFVDWNTVLNLTGLLVIVTAIRESAFIGRFSWGMLRKTANERGLALTLVALSGVLSMFLTNDIALFVTIPLTLGFQGVIKNDVKKLIIFQALAVNVGSTLTPVGNPQNLFLWHEWHISFFQFIGEMFPLFAVLSVVLLIFVWFSFSSEKLTFQNQQRKTEVNTGMFFFSVVALAVFIVSIERNVALYTLVVVILIYLAFYRKILVKVDGMLLLLFVLMFVDFHLLSQVPFVEKVAGAFNMANASDVFVGSLLSSQIMSNVPAAIFMSKFSNIWQAIAYGVNVGGNGLVMASLANIIALRFVDDNRVWLDFHKYSLLYLLISGGLAYFLFFVVF